MKRFILRLISIIIFSIFNGLIAFISCTLFYGIPSIIIILISTVLFYVLLKKVLIFVDSFCFSFDNNTILSNAKILFEKEEYLNQHDYADDIKQIEETASRNKEYQEIINSGGSVNLREKPLSKQDVIYRIPDYINLNLYESLLISNFSKVYDDIDSCEKESLEIAQRDNYHYSELYQLAKKKRELEFTISEYQVNKSFNKIVNKYYEKVKAEIESNILFPLNISKIEDKNRFIFKIVLAVLFLALSCSFACSFLFLHDTPKKQSQNNTANGSTYTVSDDEDYEAKYYEAQEKLDTAQETISDLRKEIYDSAERLDFYDSFIVFCDDNSNYYHKYDCDKWDNESFYAYNIENAEAQGYKPCPDCIK